MQALREDPRIKRIGYIGTKRGLEARIIPRYGFIEFFAIRARGFERRPSFKNFLTVFELAVGLLQTPFVLWRFRPRLIIGMGGYASFPALFWGVLLGIKTVIHEQNYFPGLVNRLMAPWVNKVLLAHEATSRFLKANVVAVVGVPVRREILEAQKNYESLGLDPQKKTLLVIGGSNGSQALTRHVLACSRELRDVQILLITGGNRKRSYVDKLARSHGTAKRPSMLTCQRANVQTEGCPANVIAKEYIDDMGDALACADLVICRAGASTLAELLALGKPAIVVPWAGAAENHQHWNARSLLNQSRYRILEEAQLKQHRLVGAIKELLADVSGQCSQSDTAFLMRNSTCLFLKEVEPFLGNVNTLARSHGTTSGRATTSTC